MTDNTAEELTSNLAKRLKSARARAGLSLRGLAKESGVAFTTIQKIENGSISPTIGILMKIARGLRIKITTLLEDEPEARTIRLIRKKERVKIEGYKQNIDIQYIAQNLINPEMMGILMTVGPGEGSGPEPLLHGGEEVVIGVQGVIDFNVGEEEYIIQPGDCLHFKCNTPHSWMNTRKKPAKFYLICSESGLAPAPPDQI